jgi:hypothetical protein
MWGVLFGGFEAELVIFGDPRWGVGFEPRCDDEINIKKKKLPCITSSKRDL